MPVVNPRALVYEDFDITQSDFTNGSEESSSVSDGTIAEIGVAEVGSDGQLSSYDAVLIGQQSTSAQGTDNVAFVDMDTDDAGTDASSDTEWRLAAAFKNKNRRRPLTKWYQQRFTSNSDPRQNPQLFPRQPFVKDGRQLIWEVKREGSGSQTIDRTGSTFRVPLQGGL